MTLKVRYALAAMLALALVVALITVSSLQRDTGNRLKVTATAYTSHPSETSGDPYLAAWNNRLTPGEKAIAVSRDLIGLGLTNGTKVKIEGLPGTYTVRDKMNKRWRRRIDIYMGNDRERALEWGKQKVALSWSE